jgi:hypothetical protein
MIPLFFLVQLLNLVQLSAAEPSPSPQKRRHCHKQMTFYDNQTTPLRSSQKSTSPRSVPYVGLQSKHNNNLEIYCHNFETIAQRSARTSGINPQKHAIVHVVRPKRKH